LIAWTSPRTTKLLHQCCYFARFPYVFAVLHEPACFGCEPTAATLTFGSLRDCLASRLGAAHTTAPRDLIEQTKAVTAETQ
jgi:hypothetical protein